MMATTDHSSNGNMGEKIDVMSMKEFSGTEQNEISMQMNLRI